MSKDVAHAHHEHPDVVGSRNRLGVILILVADIAFALSMMFVYFYLKQQNVNDMWLPTASEDMPGVKPVSSSNAWLLVGLCALGLVSNQFAVKGSKAKDSAQSNIGTGLAVIFSVAAFVLQVMQMNSTSFTTRMGAYASTYYLIAIINAVHLFITIFIAIGNWNRSRLGLYNKDHWHLSISHVWWIWMTVSAGLGAFALSFT